MSTNATSNPISTTCRPYSVSLEDTPTTPEVDSSIKDKPKKKKTAIDMLRRHHEAIQETLYKEVKDNIESIFTAIYWMIEGSEPNYEPFVVVEGLSVNIDDNCTPELTWTSYDDPTHKYDVQLTEYFVTELDKRLIAEGFTLLNTKEVSAARFYILRLN